MNGPRPLDTGLFRGYGWPLDFVAVVGTVKNTAECIGAIISGDCQKAVQKGMSALVGGVLDFVTLGVGSSFYKSGLNIGLNILEEGAAEMVAKKGAQAFARKGAQITANMVATNVGGRMVCKSLQKGMRGHGGGYGNNNSKSRSKRGDHVINNNVLNVFRDIVQSFVSDVMGDNLDDMIESGRLSKNSVVWRMINQPIPDDVANLIRYKMIVFLDGSCEDVNSVSYGKTIKALREALISYMETLYEGFLTHNYDRVPKMERNIRESVYEFIAGDYFVDKNALKVWLDKGGQAKQKFEKAHQEVTKMFRKLEYTGNNDTVITWMKELFEARRCC